MVFIKLLAAEQALVRPRLSGPFFADFAVALNCASVVILTPSKSAKKLAKQYNEPSKFK